MKLLIGGSFEYNDYINFSLKMDRVLKNQDLKGVTIIHDGHHKGVAPLADKYAKEKGMTLKVLKPDWDNNLKKAGYMNNRLLAETASHAIIFNDGRNEVTTHLVKMLTECEVPYRLFKVVVE